MEGISFLKLESGLCQSILPKSAYWTAGFFKSLPGQGGFTGRYPAIGP